MPSMSRIGAIAAWGDLVAIHDWDVNWQNTYYFESPIDLPKGSVVSVVGHFDNSAANPRNPNRPPKLVTWGEGSDQEMCVGYIAVVKKGQDLTTSPSKVFTWNPATSSYVAGTTQWLRFCSADLPVGSAFSAHG